MDNQKSNTDDIKMIHGDEALRLLEEYRERNNKEGFLTTPDVAIRCCQAIIAEMIGYKNRANWRHLQRIG